MNILLLGLITGIAFGYVLQRIGVAQCACLFNALNLKNLKAIKVIGTAIAVGIFILYPLQAAGAVALGARTLYVGGVVVGGALFGLGFAMTGLCPGTALAALGAGKKDILYLVAGALTGSFFYALVYDSLRPTLIDSWNFGGVTLVDWFGGNALLIGYIFAFALLGAVLWLNHQDEQSGAADAEACVLPQAKPQDPASTSA